jgi:hypothetical protein
MITPSLYPPYISSPTPHFQCFSCGFTSTRPITYPCQVCGQGIEHLDGTSLSAWNKSHWKQHTSLLTGSAIPLEGKEYQGSFDTVGYSKMSKLVEFTLNYGQWFTVKNRGHTNHVCLSFVPEIIGSGVSIYLPPNEIQPASGFCLMSPQSKKHGHPYPVLDDWVSQKFSGIQGHCRLCGKSTQAGRTICLKCFAENENDWMRFL